MSDRHLAAWRIAAGLAAVLAAALAPTLVWGLATGAWPFAPLAFGVALAHCLVLGLPLFLVARAKRKVSLVNALLGGFAVGLLPAAVLLWPWNRNSGATAWTNGVRTLVEGRPTAAGWLQYGEFLLYLAGLGALAGLAFWLVWRAAAPSDRARRTRVSAVPAFGLAVAALLLAGGIFALPSLTAGSSCQDRFRDGRAKLTLVASFKLDIGVAEWPKLVRLLEAFARRHGLDLLDSSESTPRVVEVLSVSLCDERGLHIYAHGQRWESQSYAPAVPGGGANVGVHETLSGSGSREAAEELQRELTAAWPGRVVSHGLP